MSTLFIANGHIAFESLRQFDEDGVHTQKSDEKGIILLTDGTNFVWVYPPVDDWPVTFEACGRNDPSTIIAAIERKLGVCLVAEHDEEFEDRLSALSVNTKEVL